MQDGNDSGARAGETAEAEARGGAGSLREGQPALELVTDALPVLVSYVDTAQRYRFVSAAYERWFGRPKAEIVGRTLEDVLGAEAYDAVRPHAERALAGTRVTYEADLPYRDGGRRSVEATYVPHLTGDGGVAGFVALVADVTERRAFDRFRASAGDRADRLATITAAVADAVTSEQVYEAVVDQVARAVDASSAGLWLVDETAGVARLVRSVGYTAETAQQLQALALDATPSVPVLDAICGEAPVWLRSQAELLARYPHLGGFVTPGRGYRVCCLPLVAQGRILGGLGLTIEQEHEALHDERGFLLLVARYASQALERLRLLEAERRSREKADAAALRLEVLGRASRVFLESDLDLETRLRVVVTELGLALGGCVGLALVAPDGLLRAKAVHHPVGQAQQQLERLILTAPLRVGEGVTGMVAATGRSVILPSIDLEAIGRVPPDYRAFVERFPVYALLCAPLRAQGQIIGTVTALRTEPGTTYTTDDLQLFEELAERAAIAVENSRLYEETADARRRAEQLYRFAQAVVAADTVESVHDAALAAIEQGVSAERSAILTFDADGVMRFRAWRNLSDAYRSAVEGHSPWPSDAIAPEPVLVEDAARDPSMASYRPLFQSEGIGALAFFPLVTRGRLLGKFMVYFDRPHAFTSHEVATATAIGNHLASVITRFSVVAELEDTIRSNELFTGVLAHDLRNPLGAMITAAQLLLMRHEGEQARDDRERKPLSRILSSGQRMTAMIDQLLDFTRARSGGGIGIDRHDTDLADLCAQVAEELELAHPEWTIVRETVGDPLGAWDPGRLQQVLSNVLANAGQHGTPGKRISLRLDGTASDRVRIDVHNDGAIPGPVQAHLFDPFRTTREHRSRSRGLGLGLFIVHEIVRAHGGTVDVASSESSGTTVSIGLPRYRATH